MKKAESIVTGILIVLGAVILREITAIAGAFIYKEEVMTNDRVLFLSALGTLAWIGLFGYIYKRERIKAGKSFYIGGIGGKRVIMLVFMGFGLQFLINSILGGIMKISPSLLENYMELIERLGMGNSLISLIYIIVIAPIGEELVFRGVVFDYLRKHVSFVTANLVQAFLFGLYHMNIVQGLYAFVLGMLLGWICNKYGSIRESILLHMAVNLSGCLVSILLPEAALETAEGLFVLFLVSMGLLAISGNAVKIEKVKSKTGEENDIN